MSMVELVAGAVDEIGRNCTPSEVFDALGDDLPPGKDVGHVARALSHAVHRGLIDRIQKGRPGGNFKVMTPGVFAPLKREPAPVPRLRWVFDLGAQA